jgi:hypothetical protein
MVKQIVLILILFSLIAYQLVCSTFFFQSERLEKQFGEEDKLFKVSKDFDRAEISNYARVTFGNCHQKSCHNHEVDYHQCEEF